MSAVYLEAQKYSISDDVANGNLKRALRNTDMLVSKFPRSSYAHAMKSVVLQKLARFETALESSLSARDVFLTYNADCIDDLTLNAMQLAFSRVQRFDLATECYLYACDQSPPTVERLVGLFYCYVREYSFAKQQQIATKLYRFVSEERFTMWAACSTLLQVYCANEGKEVLLHLAESFIKRHIKSNELHEPEALMVYIFVLEQQSKFMEAYEILSGKAGSIMVFEFDKLRLQGRLLARAGQYIRAANIFEEALKLCPDDWECFLHYLGCLLEDASNMCLGADGHPVYPPKPIDCRNLKLTDKQFDSRMTKAIDFVYWLLSKGKNNDLRGPHLARLEIERTKLEYGKGNVDKFAAEIARYFCRFGGLSCFSSDIESYLHTLEKHGKDQIWDEIISKCQSIEGSSSGDSLQQSIALFKLKLPVYKLSTIDIDVLHILAAQMTKAYLDALPMSRKHDIQEVMVCEDLLSLTCSVLIQLFWRTEKIGYLLEAILILDFGLSVRSLIWQYKILLLHLYSFWGCLPVAYEWYASLDVKNILLESVLHHILPQLLASPLWSNLKNILDSYIGFMQEFFLESAEMTVYTYRHKSYSKVVEFVQFKQRMEQSSQYLVAKIESAILKLKQNSNAAQEAEDILKSLEYGNSFVGLSDEIEKKPLAFNEDFELRPWWTPTPTKNYLSGPFDANYLPKEIWIDETKASALKAIKKRSLILRMIYLSLQCASSSVKEHTEELKLLLERYASLLGYPFQEAVDLVFGVSGGKESLEILSLDIVDWMNFVVFLNAWNLSSHDLEQSDSSTWNLVNSLLERYIPEKVRSMGTLTTSPGNDLPVLLQLVTESFTWHRLIIQSFVRPPLAKGKQKKGSAGVVLTPNLQRQEIQDSVQSLYNAISEFTKWGKQQLMIPTQARCIDLLSSLSLEDREGKEREPGQVFAMVQKCVASSNDELHGARIFAALQGWNPAKVAVFLVNGQDTILSEFIKKCEDNAKLLNGLMLRK